jgi:hypothetical protein
MRMIGDLNPVSPQGHWRSVLLSAVTVQMRFDGSYAFASPAGRRQRECRVQLVEDAESRQTRFDNRATPWPLGL